MKRLSLIVLVLSFTFAAPVTATAYDEKGLYWEYGYSCGQWVEDRKKEDGWGRVVLENWIKGYITALNARPDVYNILGSTFLKSIYLWMDKYCQENPLSNLADGMDILTIELWPNRKRTKDD